MAGSESKKTLSLWPKVLLWGAVIVVGYLYIGSIDERKSSGEQEEQAPPPSVAVTPAREAPKPDPEADVTAAGPLALDAEPVAVEEVPAPATPREVPAPPSEQPAQPPASGTPLASARSEAPPTPASPEPGHPGESARVESRRAPEAGLQTGAQSGKQSRGSEALADGARDVSSAEAEAFAKAVISETQDGVSASEPQSRAPSVSAPPAPAPVSPPSLEERRASILAEYEAMRQRAQEQMRQRWIPGSVPTPPYGGYPGYPPPGYFPPQQQR